MTAAPRDEPAATTEPTTGGPWLSRGVAGIGSASLLADVGHEVPTALLQAC